MVMNAETAQAYLEWKQALDEVDRTRREHFYAQDREALAYDAYVESMEG